MSGSASTRVKAFPEADPNQGKARQLVGQSLHAFQSLLSSLAVTLS